MQSKMRVVGLVFCLFLAMRAEAAKDAAFDFTFKGEVTKDDSGFQKILNEILMADDATTISFDYQVVNRTKMGEAIENAIQNEISKNPKINQTQLLLNYIEGLGYDPMWTSKTDARRENIRHAVTNLAWYVYTRQPANTYDLLVRLEYTVAKVFAGIKTDLERTYQRGFKATDDDKLMEVQELYNFVRSYREDIPQSPLTKLKTHVVGYCRMVFSKIQIF
jgi:hypothetical protein